MGGPFQGMSVGAAEACFAWTACQFDNRELGFLVGYLGGLGSEYSWAPNGKS